MNLVFYVIEYKEDREMIQWRVARTPGEAAELANNLAKEIDTFPVIRTVSMKLW